MALDKRPYGRKPRAAFDNKCPVCHEDGVRDAERSQSDNVYHPHSDGNGVEHVHDYNNVETDYHCAQGHRWRLTTRRPCPSCDWPHEKPRMTFLGNVEKPRRF